MVDGSSSTIIFQKPDVLVPYDDFVMYDDCIF